jgi:hypothetical protein
MRVLERFCVGFATGIGVNRVMFTISEPQAESIDAHNRPGTSFRIMTPP